VKEKEKEYTYKKASQHKDNGNGRQCDPERTESTEDSWRNV